MNAGTTGTPLPATGTPLSYGESFTNGATGRGGVSMSGGATWREVTTTASSLSYRLDDGFWRIEAGLSRSVSDSAMRNRENGQFNNYSAAVTVPVRVVFSGHQRHAAGPGRVFDDSNREVDIYDIRNYRATTASGQLRHHGQVRVGQLERASRAELPAGAGCAAIGGARRVQTNDTQADSPAYTFNGPDGNPNL